MHAKYYAPLLPTKFLMNIIQDDGFPLYSLIAKVEYYNARTPLLIRKEYIWHQKENYA